TTHYFAPRLSAVCEQYGAEFVSMPEATGAWLKAHDVHKVGLVGIRYVTELEEWSAYREPLREIEVERLSERGLNQVSELAYKVKTSGVTEAALNSLRDILN